MQVREITRRPTCGSNEATRPGKEVTTSLSYYTPSGHYTPSGYYSILRRPVHIGLTLSANIGTRTHRRWPDFRHAKRPVPPPDRRAGVRPGGRDRGSAHLAGQFPSYTDPPDSGAPCESAAAGRGPSAGWRSERRPRARAPGLAIAAGSWSGASAVAWSADALLAVALTGARSASDAAAACLDGFAGS